jgi:molybdenum cofactor cytidylyltransferase
MQKADALAVILAAEQPPNLPLPPALLEYEGGRSLLEEVASACRKGGLGRVVVVVGQHADDVTARHPELVAVHDGAGTGLRKGLQEALSAEDVQEIFVLPVEHAALRPSTLATLLKAARGAHGAVPEFEGALGRPVLLSRAGAEAVLADGATGLEQALAGLQLERIKVRDPGVVVAFREPQLFERILGSAPHAAPPRKRGGKKKPNGGAGEEP